MDIWSGYHQTYDAELRLRILQLLAKQADYQLNEVVLRDELMRFAFNRGRSHLRNQLQFMEHEARAVFTREVEGQVIAQLTERGLDHVEGRLVLDGIKKSPPMRV